METQDEGAETKGAQTKFATTLKWTPKAAASLYWMNIGTPNWTRELSRIRSALGKVREVKKFIKRSENTETS